MTFPALSSAQCAARIRENFMPFVLYSFFHMPQTHCSQKKDGQRPWTFKKIIIIFLYLWPKLSGMVAFSPSVEQSSRNGGGVATVGSFTCILKLIWYHNNIGTYLIFNLIFPVLEIRKQRSLEAFWFSQGQVWLSQDQNPNLMSPGFELFLRH